MCVIRHWWASRPTLFDALSLLRGGRVPIRWRHPDDREVPVVMTWDDIQGGLCLAFVFFVLFVILRLVFQVP
jgi:hypothetical protein